MDLTVNPSLLRVMRILRIGRLLRYFKGAKGIRRLLVALIISLPALFNIGTLLFLILFIYSILGMSSFGHVKKQGVLNDVVNFETFGNSMHILFRLATSAGWNDVLDSLMVRPPQCDLKYKDLPNGNCGNPWLAISFMVTFILFTFMIIVNMYIAIILENFNQAHQDEEMGVTDDDIRMFYSHWQRFDPTASQYIDYDQLWTFLDELEEPLRITKPDDITSSELDIPIKNGDKIHCGDVLLAALKHAKMRYLTETDLEGLATVVEQVERKLSSTFPVRTKDITITTTKRRLQEIKAVIIIQRQFRRWKTRTRKSKHSSMDTLPEQTESHVEPSSRVKCTHITVEEPSCRTSTEISNLKV